MEMYLTEITKASLFVTSSAMQDISMIVKLAQLE